ATPRSRSSHELLRIPPYTSTASCFQPAVALSGDGLTRRQGESVCAPASRNGASTGAAGGVLHAIRPPPRTTNPSDGRADQSSPSDVSLNPAAASRSAAARAAWNGDGELSR